jgi:peroxiredoxin
MLYGQNENVYPVTINEKFPDITLQTSEGEDVAISEYLGKKVMLIFIRGKVTPDIWCPICQYQYLEMVNVEENKNLQEKFNMEILFAMPYVQDSLSEWISAFPQSLNTIHNWKFPDDSEDITDAQKEWAEYSRKFFPETFDFSPEEFELTLPLLFDPDRKVSEGLMIFRNEWGGTTVAQNVPTIFIIDEKGFVKFKYFSQYTNDRPSPEFLIKILEKMF